MTPMTRAALDQASAKVDAMLDGLLAEARSQAAADGQDQAAANMALAVTILPSGILPVVLFATPRRLAFPPVVLHEEQA